MVSLTLRVGFWSHWSVAQSHGGGPEGAVVVASTHEDDHPEEGHDEAEDGDKHHPSHGVGWAHVGGGHQGPHQTTKHLKQASQNSEQKANVLALNPD